MTVKGHILVATTIASLTIPTIFLSKIAAFLLILGAVFPDLDEPQSFIGRKLFFLSYPLRAAGLKHRTFSHSVFFALLFLPLILFNSVFIYFILGIFLHLIGDMLTKTGVPLFYPAKKYFALLPNNLRFKTGGAIEHIIIIILLAYNFYFFTHFLHLNFYKYYYILYNTHNVVAFKHMFAF